MGNKRKAAEQEPAESRMDVDQNDSGSDDDEEMLQVDFEWFDPQPAVDFHGLKTLLRQLLEPDHERFDLSSLADLILSQPTLGSTVKCDGHESDPFAFLTVLNLTQHRDHPAVRSLIAYLIERCGSPARTLTGTSPAGTLSRLITPPPISSTAKVESDSPEPGQVGLILSERLINMPPQVVPPMYNMLLEEMGWAVRDAEPFAFGEYLVLSRVYSEVESVLGAAGSVVVLEGDDEEDEGRGSGSKKKKKKRRVDVPAMGPSGERFYFHAEDEVLEKHARGVVTFDYFLQGDGGDADSKRAFSELGIKPQGHLMMISDGSFQQAVKEVNEFIGGGDEAA